MKLTNVKKRKDLSRLGNTFKVNLNIFISLFNLFFKIILYKMIDILKK